MRMYFILMHYHAPATLPENPLHTIHDRFLVNAGESIENAENSLTSSVEAAAHDAVCAQGCYAC
jgi:hypothetical protein